MGKNPDSQSTSDAFAIFWNFWCRIDFQIQHKNCRGPRDRLRVRNLSNLDIRLRSYEFFIAQETTVLHSFSLYKLRYLAYSETFLTKLAFSLNEWNEDDNHPNNMEKEPYQYVDRMRSYEIWNNPETVSRKLRNLCWKLIPAIFLKELAFGLNIWNVE